MDTGSAVIGCQQKSNIKSNQKYGKNSEEYTNSDDDSYPLPYKSNNKNKYNDNAPSRKHTRYKPKKNSNNEVDNNRNEQKVKKRVKFSNKVTTIKVECWKKCNLEHE